MRKVLSRAVITFSFLACAQIVSAQAVKLDPISIFASPAPDGDNGLPNVVSQGANGFLYGVSAFSPGTTVAIFQISPATHSHLVAATIDLGQTNPNVSRLVLASDGRFYASFFADQGGGILRFDPATNATSIVRQFLFDDLTGMPGPDGVFPGPLTRGHDGALYGAMELSSTDINESGSLFRFDPVGGAFTTLHAFDLNVDGAYPFAPIVEGADGIWYGTNVDATFCGSAFKFDANASTLTSLHTFDINAEGCAPGGLAVLPSGLLVGATTMGNFDPANPASTTGGVFTLDSITGNVTPVHMFLQSDPLAPISPGNVLAAPGGNVYVLGQNYATGIASVLRVHPDSGQVDDVADLTGAVPEIGELTIGSDARIYGVFASTQLFALGVLDPLPVAAAGGMAGTTTTLSATLTALGMPLAGRTIVFSLNGVQVASAVTNAAGVATRDNVSLAGIAAGTYPSGVKASFAGDAQFPAASGTGLLNVLSAVTPGMMVGDGFINQNQLRYDFAFVVQEKPNGSDRGALALQVRDINDGHKKKTTPRNDIFIALSYSAVTFTLDSSTRPLFDTVVFAGNGYWNGRSGYRFEATALDRLGPNKHSESFKITVYDSLNNIVASVDAVLSGGNMKSLRLHK
jgi:hypothetical protein